MNHDEETKIKNFGRSLDALITGKAPQGAIHDPETAEMLEIAKMLYETDLSAESSRLDEIGQKVMGQTEFLKHVDGEAKMTMLKRLQTSPLKSLALSAAALALFAATVLAVPPLRNFAQELFDELFPRSESDRKTIEYNYVGDDDMIYAKTLAEIEDEIPFDVKTPELSDSELLETHAGYNTSRNVVWHSYRTESRLFNIQQQPIADAESSGLFGFIYDRDIGPEAEIESVQIGESLIGDLVVGDWGTSSTDPNRTYRWVEDAPAVTLRWQDDTYIYEVLMLPMEFDGRTNREYQPELIVEAIALANELMD